jgi:uncharacterized membrane protein
MSALHDATGIATTGFVSPFPTIASGRPRPHHRRALERRQSWERRYRWILRTSDAAAVAFTCAVASVVSIGAVSGPLAVADPGLVFQIAAATAVIWLLMLSAFATRDVKLIGSGAAEYTRMIHATGFAFGLLAMIDVAIDVDGIRAQLFVALPLGIGVLLFERWLWRRWLIRRRLAGAYTTRAIVVGERADVEYVIRSIADPGLGYQVVGASLRGRPRQPARRRRHLPGDAHAQRGRSSRSTRRRHDHHRQPRRRRRRRDQAPRLAAGEHGRRTGDLQPRLRCRRAAHVAAARRGLPLIHVEIASFTGRAYLAKRALDIAVASIALLSSRRSRRSSPSRSSSTRPVRCSFPKHGSGVTATSSG